MIGAGILVLTVILGYSHVSMWSLLPIAVINNFIGMYLPRNRMNVVDGAGVGYWRVFLTNLPLISILTLAVYGLGYGVSLLSR